MILSTRLEQLANFDRAGFIDNQWCDENMQRVRELLLLRARYVKLYQENELDNSSQARTGSEGVSYCNGELMRLLSINAT